MYYIYDGTYAGFLTTVYTIYHEGTSQLEGIRIEGMEPVLFGTEKQVDMSFQKANDVAIGFEKACGKTAMRWLYRAFLSDDPGKEMPLFRFIQRGFKLKKAIYRYQKEDWVQDVLDMCREVGNETEKFRGITRFSELEEGMLFATINPTHNILPVLAVHFEERLSSERWAIYDVNRGIAGVYENGKVSLVVVPKLKEHLTYSEKEEAFRSLWKGYFSHMAIKERTNPKLQMNYLPKKYWAYLTEKQ